MREADPSPKRCSLAGGAAGACEVLVADIRRIPDDGVVTRLRVHGKEVACSDVCVKILRSKVAPGSTSARHVQLGPGQNRRIGTK